MNDRQCEACGNALERRENEGAAQWGNRRFCSKRCAGYRPVPVEKRCSCCGETKPAEAFRTANGNRPRSHCRTCDAAHAREQYAANITVNRERKRLWMAEAWKDPDKQIKLRESQRRTYNNGGNERQRERITTMKQAQPFRWKARLARRWNPDITEQDLIDMWNRQDGRCDLTGRLIDPATADLDHIVPKSRGGSHDLSNIRWVSREANMAKRNLTDEEFLALCEDVTEWLARRIVASSPPSAWASS